MNNTSLVSMEKLFNIAGYKYEDVKENTWIDIKDKNIFISSYDHIDKKKTKQQILKLVRKKDDVLYEVRTLNDIVLLKCSSEHFIYDPVLNDYVSVKKIKNGHALLNNNEAIAVYAVKTNKVSPILDMEVETTQNYFSNSILSHNTPAGLGLKFAASIRLEVSIVGGKKDSDSLRIANMVKAVPIKNKTAPPYKVANFVIRYGEGIDIYGDYLAELTKREIIKKSGAWYSYNETRVGQGEENARQFLKDNPEVLQEMLAWLDKKQQ